MIWLISGPTCAGKSTFLKSQRCLRLTNLPTTTPIVWPATAQKIVDDALTDCFFHYNILRPIDLFLNDDTSPQLPRRIDFTTDSPWVLLKKQPIPKHSLILIADKQTLLKRARQRQIIEENLLTHQKEKVYPWQHWVKLITNTDLEVVYRSWRQELIDNDISFTLLDASDSDYRLIRDDRWLKTLNNS